MTLFKLIYTTSVCTLNFKQYIILLNVTCVLHRLAKGDINIMLGWSYIWRESRKLPRSCVLTNKKTNACGVNANIYTRWLLGMLKGEGKRIYKRGMGLETNQYVFLEGSDNVITMPTYWEFWTFWEFWIHLFLIYWPPMSNDNDKNKTRWISLLLLQACDPYRWCVLYDS